MPLAKDLLYETPQGHKIKKLVPQPNSYFMDVKCPVCYTISVMFSHSTTRVKCKKCNVVLCTPKGGKGHLREGCSFRIKKT